MDNQRNMKGICIKPVGCFKNLTPVEIKAIPKKRLNKTDETSEFQHIFKPIISDLRELFWIGKNYVGEVPFEIWKIDNGKSKYDPDTDCYISGPLKDFFNQQRIIPVHKDTSYTGFPGELLEKYASFVDDDWTTMYGFRHPPENWKSWYRNHYPKNIVRQISETVDIVLFNPDATFWYLFTHEIQLIECIKSHINRNHKYRIIDEKLERWESKINL